jgi:Zn ribbon nucleic-acid-binding protein
MPTCLKEERYYSDLYDLRTIESCLGLIESYRITVSRKSAGTEAKKNLSEQGPKCIPSKLYHDLYIIKGESYRRKTSVIREWMNYDRHCDGLFQKAKEPGNARCPHCDAHMNLTLKELYTLDAEPRIRFLFECASCKRRDGVFDNGERFISKPLLCPKCGQVIKVTCVEEGKNLIISRNCSACGFSETEINDFDKRRDQRIAEENRKMKLLKQHRAEFCLSEAEGEEFLQTFMRLQNLEEIFKRVEQRQTDPNHQKLADLKKNDRC